MQITNSNPTIVYNAKTLSEIQVILKNIPGIVPVSGATTFYRTNGSEFFEFPEHILNFSDIPELTAVVKNERSLEFGALCTFEQLLSIGKKNIPILLFDALEQSTHNVLRSIATIGGNIAQVNYRSACFSPLLILDAKIEFRTAQEIFRTSLLQYLEWKMQYPDVSHVIIKLRVPYMQWNISCYKKLYPNSTNPLHTSAFMFVGAKQRNTLSDVRIALSNNSLVRSKEFENILIGRDMPIDKKDFDFIVEQAHLDFPDENFNTALERKWFFNMLEYCLFDFHFHNQ